MAHYYFAEVKDGVLYSLHDSTSLDLIFRTSDGLLVELNEREYDLLSACRMNINDGISKLKQVRTKIETKVAENAMDL